MIRVGDLVIRNTGGNKMRVVSIENNKAECAWITEYFNQATFKLEDLLPLSDYNSLFKDEKRNDIISFLLEK